MHYHLIEFNYIHDNIGPGYVGLSCCTNLSSDAP